MGRFWYKWRGMIILLLVLGILVWLYSLFNGGSAEDNLVTFLKTDALKMLIIVVAVSIGIIILKKIFRAPVHR